MTNANSTIQPSPKNEGACTNTSCCPPQAPAARTMPKVGRNDPCPCGNGKKFKKCCGLNNA